MSTSLASRLARVLIAVGLAAATYLVLASISPFGRFLSGEAALDPALLALSPAPQLRASPRINYTVIGWPLETLAVVFFLACAGLMRIGRRSDTRAPVAHVVLYSICVLMMALLIQVGVGLRQSSQSLHILHYVVAGTIFCLYVAVSYLPQPPIRAAVKALPSQVLHGLRRPLPWVFGATVVAFLALNPQAAPTPTSSGPPTGADFLEWYKTQPRIELPSSLMVAPVTLVRFVDYECPGSKLSDEQHSGELSSRNETMSMFAVLSVDFPIDRECNPDIKRDLHKSACEASAAMRMARELGKDDTFKKWIFKHQADLSPERVKEAAQTIVGVADYEARYSSVLKEIESDVAIARSLGITRTPTYILNGVKLPYLPLSDLLSAIDYELDIANGRLGSNPESDRTVAGPS